MAGPAGPAGQLDRAGQLGPGGPGTRAGRERCAGGSGRPWTHPGGADRRPDHGRRPTPVAAADTRWPELPDRPRRAVVDERSPAAVLAWSGVLPTADGGATDATDPLVVEQRSR
ncbi:hypothetical protein [Cellulomonas sp. ATA003]|uniref:hypothetical protein n=1 Tax=Cellulomonas sp. ATA003 TaxID=3073064 RepID=UPI002873E93E|nr:hypothetical protein [Cellulomonas sp. ATA003]WNB87299.1 hypothetical protein REH70_09470 [Cellulomonas sp. ATA003]